MRRLLRFESLAVFACLFALASAAFLAAPAHTRGVALACIGAAILLWAPLTYGVQDRLIDRWLRTGQQPKAIQLLRTIWASTHSPHQRALYAVELSLALLLDEQHEQALELLRTMDRTRLSGSARAVYYNNLAYARARLRQEPDLALAHASEAIRLLDEPAFHHTLALAFIARGDGKSAIPEIEKAIAGEPEADPGFVAERLHSLGEARRAAGEREKALDAYREAAKLTGTRYGRRAQEWLSSVGAS